MYSQDNFKFHKTGIVKNTKCWVSHLGISQISISLLQHGQAAKSYDCGGL